MFEWYKSFALFDCSASMCQLHPCLFGIESISSAQEFWAFESLRCVGVLCLFTLVCKHKIRLWYAFMVPVIELIYDYSNVVNLQYFALALPQTVFCNEQWVVSNIDSCQFYAELFTFLHNNCSSIWCFGCMVSAQCKVHLKALTAPLAHQ